MPRLSWMCLLLLTACSPTPTIPEKRPVDPEPAPTPKKHTVTFRDRTIDLEPFLLGQPYFQLQPDLEHGQLFYFEKTPQGTWLRQLALPETGTIDLSQGRKVNDIDWSKRSYWRSKLHAASNRLFITSDESNDEQTNVYAIDLDSGEVEQLTHNDYTYGWSLSDDGTRLAYLGRSGKAEPFETCLVVRDLASGAEQIYYCDGGGVDRFTWADLQFWGDAIIARVQHDGQRTTTTIAVVRPQSLAFPIPPRVVRLDHSAIRGRIGSSTFFYRSAETGFAEIYSCDLSGRTPEPKKLTDFRENLAAVELLDTDPPTLLAVLGRPHESELRLLDAATGDELTATKLPAQVNIQDTHGDRAILSLNSLTSPFRFARLRVDKGVSTWRLELEELVGLPEELRTKISHVVPEKVSYPTFDLGPDNEPRQLHAFYLEPKSPPELSEDRRVMIVSFYGGSNNYRTDMNIFAAAGIAIMSPSPRGSWGFGAEFESLNDGDLGGDEIVDIIAAAEWLVAEKGYQPNQIGVYGGSHGGYATLRALTFPPTTNGRNARFDFGFGWSHAGFSDITTFYESCNIPDWVVKEAGDPKTESKKLKDRSPYYHVEKLTAPVLLTHGENDWRVPVDESRKFVARAAALGKQVEYVEFAGQGHGIQGFDNQVKYYQSILEFIEALDYGQE